VTVRGASLTVAGATPEELFRNAARAAAGLMVDAGGVQGGGLRDRLRVEASSREALLMDWVNLVLRQQSENRVLLAEIVSLVLTAPSAGKRWVLEAVTEGELLDPVRHGALRTFAGAAVEELSEKGGGWRARLSFSGPGDGTAI
jgi:SHS2 domain-containing protein